MGEATEPSIDTVNRGIAKALLPRPPRRYGIYNAPPRARLDPEDARWDEARTVAARVNVSLVGRS